ncbi:hypothetical protein JCM19232_2279 [Vibrio ishigakensis]|uniref:Uncharacterized protein n=1 Tax=Vibrio ishigakensis TaxID=1481914 RepID=A0A0B8PMF0_9VIBR|nr:hypothetical protein JCM19232_2279 [Vibrio ishigakensis]
MCWMIVLIGAEITASLGEDRVWRVDEPLAWIGSCTTSSY